MNWVDVLLLVLVVLSAIHGLRLGAAMQVLSFGGFWLGLLIGALIAPLVARHIHDSTVKAFVATVILFGMAVLVGGFGRYLGVHSSSALQRIHLGSVDSAAGVGVAVLATLVLAWLVASVISSSRFTSLNSAISDSRIVRAMDNVMPPPPSVFSRIQSFLASEGFPVVFAGLPPQISAPVPLPSTNSLATAVNSDADSTVQITGAACGLIQEGSGFVVAPDVVVTNAHVVAGVARPYVNDPTTGRHVATPVLYDPQLDVAVLRVPGLDARPLPLIQGTNLVSRGTTGAVLGYPEGGPFKYVPAGVAQSFSATGLDIYGNATTTREIYELDTQVLPGNSGGPLVASGDSSQGIADGTVIGVVFARSTTDSTIGYALAMPAVEKDIAAGEASTTAVSTSGCTTG